mmetsp:Transcript_26157/g.29283  ORF Transcript_26157/g.29283 Transcript_26157/m.29283 type:complete len:85 (-) Transcript_26157:216-470(-)
MQRPLAQLEWSRLLQYQKQQPGRLWCRAAHDHAGERRSDTRTGSRYRGDAQERDPARYHPGRVGLLEVPRPRTETHERAGPTGS